jgi:hypothetical protein
MNAIPIPTEDQEHEFVFVVKIKAHGPKEKRLQDVTIELSRGLNDTFQRYEVWHGGKQVVYDAFAHDREHDGHDSILRVIE